jgi:hypothetical protein
MTTLLEKPFRPTFDSAAAFVDYLTDYPELAERNKAYFELTNAEEKAAFKAAMYADLATRPEAEKKAFMDAQARLQEAMLNHMNEMQKRLKRVLKQSKKEPVQ